MRGRTIKPNETTRIPTAHIAVDTETTGIPDDTGTVRHRLMVGCAIYWRTEGGRARSREEFTFATPIEFWQWVSQCLSPHRSTWIWAHNAGFDMTILRLWDMLNCGEIHEEFGVYQSPPFIMVGSMLERSMTIVDTLNFFRQPLAKLGEWVQLAKLPMPGESASETDWQTYCMRDAWIVERVVNRLCGFVRYSDLGNMKYTIAGQAMACWRHKHIYVNVVPPNHKQESQLARDAYYGGQVELMFRGRVRTPLVTCDITADKGARFLPTIPSGPVHILDVNSCYLAIMRDSMLPVSLRCYTEECSVSDLARELFGSLVCADVDISTTVPMPVRCDGIGTLYCVGRFRTCLTTHELDEVFRSGQVHEVFRIATYNRGLICRKYADYWLAARNIWHGRNDAIMEAVCKLFGNSLYGKWGQKSPAWQATDEFEEPPIKWGAFPKLNEDGSVTNYRVRFGKVEKEVEQGETQFSFPAISAHVTAYARERMRHFAGIAGARNVYYQCSDAIHVSRAGYDALCSAGVVSPTKPGLLRLTSEEDDVIYWGVNCLRTGKEFRCAGISRNAVERGDGSWEVADFEPLDAILSRQPDGTVRVSTAVKTPPRCYRHRKVEESGWTRPLVLPQEWPSDSCVSLGLRTESSIDTQTDTTSRPND